MQISNSPIIDTDEDAFEFKEYAQKIQEFIRNYNSGEEALTIGIYGKWGSGKTSFVNMINQQLELKKNEGLEIIKYSFSPWNFNSKEEIFEEFFFGLSRKLKIGDTEIKKKIGAKLLKYSKYLKAIKLSASGGVPKAFNFGVSVDPGQIIQSLGEDLQGDESLEDLKLELDKLLKDSKFKIVITIDDIDRLDKDEIYYLFKLIKVSANFPNIIFLVLMDKEHVSKAIYSRYGDELSSGEKFLDKIVNLPVVVPIVEKHLVQRFIDDLLFQILGKYPLPKLQIDELFDSLDCNIFETPRKLIKTLNSFDLSLSILKEEINIHDLFWLEFLKVNYNCEYNILKKLVYSENLDIFLNQLIYIDIEDFWARVGERNLNDEVEFVLNRILPKEDVLNRMVYLNRTLSDVRNAELNFNHVNHRDKYFSFHLSGKLSVSKLKSILERIKLDDLNDFSLEEYNHIELGLKVAVRLRNELKRKNTNIPQQNRLKFILKEIEFFKNHLISHGRFPKVFDTVMEIFLENPDFILLNDLEVFDLYVLYCIGGSFNVDKDFTSSLSNLIMSKVEKEDINYFDDKKFEIEFVTLLMEANHVFFENYVYKNVRNESDLVAILRFFSVGIEMGSLNEKDQMIRMSFREPLRETYLNPFFKKSIEPSKYLFKLACKIVNYDHSNFDWEQERDEWHPREENAGVKHIMQYIYYYQQFSEEVAKE